MKKKLIAALVILLIFGGGVGMGWYIRNQTLNPRAAIPGAFERLLGFLVQKGESENDDLLYYDTDLADFIVNGSQKTKIAVEGIVDKVAKQPDGDYHIVMRPQYAPVGLYLVTESIPEIKLTPPKEGEHIKIWGIVRFDILHNWWEIHPVIGWEIVK